VAKNDQLAIIKNHEVVATVDLPEAAASLGPLSPKGVLYLVSGQGTSIRAWQVPSLGGPAAKGWPMTYHDNKNTNRSNGP
jgi:hypothetical protein